MAVANQQFAMTSINNLALLLNESLEKMNQKMSSSMKAKSGNKSCQNPSGSGKGKKSAKNMKDLQEKIGKQLQKLKEGMDGAKKDGKGKPQQICNFVPAGFRRMPPGLTRPAIVRTLGTCLSCPPF